MAKQGLVSREIEDFYNKASEEDRLNSGLGMFEFERIKALISRFLSKDSLLVDVGGGTGKYAEWLAQLGHTVYLIEPLDKHLKLAEKRAAKFKARFKVIKGEAQALDVPSEKADVVILHGPLYHLQQEGARLKAIQEAKRVLKPGGVILGFAINYSASTIVGLMNGLIHVPSFLAMCQEELSTGMHQAPADLPGMMAEAYYHKPSQLKAEFEACGLEVDKLYAVEGMTWLDKTYFESMLNKQKRKNLDAISMLTENDEQLLTLSPHMMIAAYKPK